MNHFTIFLILFSMKSKQVKEAVFGLKESVFSVLGLK